eukprot:1785354-Pyramimonas_sp.AAC.1
MPASANPCPPVRIHARQCQSMPASANPCPPVRIHARQCQSMPASANRSIVFRYGVVLAPRSAGGVAQGRAQEHTNTRHVRTGGGQIRAFGGHISVASKGRSMSLSGGSTRTP